MSVTIPLVDLRTQYESLRGEVGDAIQKVLSECSFILGPAVDDFEKRFAAYCGVEHCVSVASGTDALHLMLRGLDVGPGDEVILPAMTFVATALGVSLAGATPVLVDVRGDDALLDASRVEEAITPRTRAILPVHLYGQCADMDALRTLADSRGLLLLEDAAQAHGATYRGKKAGALSRAAAFSFYPGKNLGAYGDGGAITTDDAALADRLRLLRNWGSRKKYHHEEPGLNSRLDSIQAAVLGVKLPYLDGWNASRQAHAATYRRLLAGRDDLRLCAEPSDGTSALHLFVVRCADRDARLQKLHAHGIQAGIHYPFPVHRLGAYAALAHSGRDLSVSEAWARECLSLPMFAELTEDAIERICGVL